jgi:hypothetical protein
MKKVFIKLYFIAIFFSVVFYDLSAKSCWNEYEISQLEHLENDGYMAFSFKDAVTCRPIVNATVKILGEIFTTDIDGMIRFDSELIDFVDSDYINLRLEKKGYIQFDHKINFILGTVFNKTFSVSKKMTFDQARFVLSWGHTPRDLDLHLKTDNFHISFRDKRQFSDIAKLDRDAIYGFGPETITLNKVEVDKKYSLYVHKYSHDAIMKNVIVEVYKRNKLNKSVTIPKAYTKCFHVLDMEYGFITYIMKPVEEKKCE